MRLKFDVALTVTEKDYHAIEDLFADMEKEKKMFNANKKRIHENIKRAKNPINVKNNDLDKTLNFISLVWEDVNWNPLEEDSWQKVFMDFLNNEERPYHLLVMDKEIEDGSNDLDSYAGMQDPECIPMRIHPHIRRHIVFD